MQGLRSSPAFATLLRRSPPPRRSAERLRRAFLPVLLLLAHGVLAAQPAGRLRAGAARVEITSMLNQLQPAEQPATGLFEQEHIFVRAIVFENGTARGALIGADATALSDEIWRAAAAAIARELDCPVANILMSATHSHSVGTPGGAPPTTAPATDAPLTPYMRLLSDSMVKAVREARTQLQPALVGYGTGAAYLNVNRDAVSPETHRWTQAPNPQAVSDKTVSVVQFVRPTGEPIGVYVDYAMHPVDAYLLGFLTADVPGAMCRYVEQSFDDKAVVIFAQGASGDQNPLYLRPSTNAQASRRGAPVTGYDLTREPIESSFRDDKTIPTRPVDPAVRQRLERFIEAEGAVLGEEVIRVMTMDRRLSANASIWGAQREIECPGRVRTDAGREGVSGSYAEAPAKPIRLSVVGVGDVALAGVDAEIYTRIGLRVRAESPLADTVVVTLANGRAPTGYLPDDESYGHQTFQVLGATVKPGCAEAGIADGLAAMIATQHAGEKP